MSKRAAKFIRDAYEKSGGATPDLRQMVGEYLASTHALAVNAMAESWASIDGKIGPYRREARGAIREDHPDFTGHYLGYQAEAEEMITRLGKRGFRLVPTEIAPPHNTGSTSA